MFKKASFSILMICMLSFTFVGCGQERQSENNTPDTSLQDIQEKGNFILGVYEDTPPLSFIDRNEKVVGFDIELMTEVANRMSVAIQVETINSENGLQELKNKELDVINGIAIGTGTEVSDEIDFSKPYIDNRSIIIVRSDSDIHTKDNFKNKTVGVVLNSDGYLAIKGDQTFMNSIAELLEYENDQKIMAQLGTGTIDAVIVKETFGRYIMKQRPSEFRIIDEVGSELYGMGFRKGDNTLRDEMDRIISEMKEDGTLERISKKWFGSNIVIE